MSANDQRSCIDLEALAIGLLILDGKHGDWDGLTDAGRRKWLNRADAFSPVIEALLLGAVVDARVEGFAAGFQSLLTTPNASYQSGHSVGVAEERARFTAAVESLASAYDTENWRIWGVPQAIRAALKVADQ